MISADRCELNVGGKWPFPPNKSSRIYLWFTVVTTVLTTQILTDTATSTSHSTSLLSVWTIRDFSARQKTEEFEQLSPRHDLYYINNAITAAAVQITAAIPAAQRTAAIPAARIAAAQNVMKQ